jgi:hypothetical protein
MSREKVYLALTIVGTLAPGIFGAPYLLEHGYNPAHIMPAIFSSQTPLLDTLSKVID